MKLRYKVEVRCLLNKDKFNILKSKYLICVVRKAYFRRKRNAERYINEILNTYYRNNYTYMSFNQYVVNDVVENGVHKTTIDLYMGRSIL